MPEGRTIYIDGVGPMYRCFWALMSGMVIVAGGFFSVVGLEAAGMIQKEDFIPIVQKTLPLSLVPAAIVAGLIMSKQGA